MNEGKIKTNIEKINTVIQVSKDEIQAEFDSIRETDIYLKAIKELINLVEISEQKNNNKLYRYDSRLSTIENYLKPFKVKDDE